MPPSTPKTETETTKPAGLVDSSGNYLPERATWRDRWRLASSRTKIIITSFVAFVVTTSVVLTNLASILQYFRPRPVPPSVPLIIVKLSNTQKTPVQVMARGDFLLWLPGADGEHMIGKYEFRTADDRFPVTGQIDIAPNTVVTVYAKILDQNFYGRLLERGDCDISFEVRRLEGGLKFTDNLPFTKEAIARYFVPADVGSD